MSEAVLYNLLKRIPDATDAEVEKAVEGVVSAKDVATKLDIAELKTDIANLEIRLVKQLYGAVGIILVGVGLMIKFL